MVVFTIVALSGQIRAMTFDCHFSKVSWEYIGSQYACQSRILDMVENETVVTNVTGDHDLGRDNDNVGVLEIEFQIFLTKVPERIVVFFKNLLGLSITSCKLLSISNEDLKPFPKLQLLFLEQNKITNLDGNLLVNTPKLRQIAFGWNNLENVGAELFDSVKDLESAWFFENPCIDMYATRPIDMQILKESLLTNCPPLQKKTATLSTTTTLPGSGECSIECLTKIENLDADFKQEKVALNKEVEEQNSQINNLNSSMFSFELRLIELEKQIREIKLAK